MKEVEVKEDLETLSGIKRAANSAFKKYHDRKLIIGQRTQALAAKREVLERWENFEQARTLMAIEGKTLEPSATLVAEKKAYDEEKAALVKMLDATDVDYINSAFHIYDHFSSGYRLERDYGYARVSAAAQQIREALAVIAKDFGRRGCKEKLNELLSEVYTQYADVDNMKPTDWPKATRVGRLEKFENTLPVPFERRTVECANITLGGIARGEFAFQDWENGKK